MMLDNSEYTYSELDRIFKNSKKIGAFLLTVRKVRDILIMENYSHS